MSSPQSDSGWRERLDYLVGSRPPAEDARPWGAIVADADALRTAVAAAGAVAANSHPERATDTATTLVDALDLYEHDTMRDDLVAALQRHYPQAYGPLDIDAIADRIGAMSDVQLRSVMNGVQGAMLEMHVEDLFDSGQLELPDGAVRFVLGDAHEAAIDGAFLDEAGEIVEVMQIKASQTAAPIVRHLAKNPDIDVIYANSEAAEAADLAGVDVTDTGAELDDLLPSGGVGESGPSEFLDELTDSLGERLGDLADDLPLVAMTVIAAQSAWRLHQGVGRNEILEDAKRRSRSVVSWSVLGQLATTVTGVESARFGAIAAGKGGLAGVRAIEGSYARVVDPATQRLRETRRLLATVEPTTAPD